jgi:superfamily II DNA/RNA helicase
LIINMAKARRRQPTALVLAPTRELAQQIADALRPLARDRDRAVTAVYGGVGYAPQRKALDGGADLVVACPGRLEDLLSMGALKLSDVRHVVVDEADRMADMGFMPAVKRLLEQTHPERQVLLFSATLDGAVDKLATSVQQSPVRHEIDATEPDLAAAHHVFWRVDRLERPQHTAQVARELGSTLVFCRTRHGADRLAQQLARSGVSAAAIHGGRSQPQRDKALKAFASGSVSVLVATDVAARGVHVDDVAAVVHFDPPADAATYVHRSGRTARAGATGVIVSLVEKGTDRSVRTMQREVGIEANVAFPSLDQLRPAVTIHTSAAKPAAVKSHAAVDRRVGTVSFFHERRGFGFIDGEQGADVFIHHTSLRSNVAKGQRVEYAVRQGKKGLEAVDVVAV